MSLRPRPLPLLLALSSLLSAPFLPTQTWAEYRLTEVSPQQDALLDAVVARATSGTVVLFDLDSTTLDNRPRQVAILRAWASREGVTELSSLRVDHFQEWDLDDTLRRAGVAPEGRKALARRAMKAWRQEFWGIDGLVYDLPVPGAARFARSLHERGATIAYIGRRDTQAEATRAALERFGFPLGERGRLLAAHVEGGGRDEDDRAWRATLDQAAALGTVVAAFDNEGSKVDLLRERFPEATVVHVLTDGPRFTKRQGPFARGFLRTGDARGHPEDVGPDVPASDTELTVERVPDGDTLVARDPTGERHVIRLIGIDTPEKDGLYAMSTMADKRRRHVEAFGPRVVETAGSYTLGRDALAKLVEGRPLLLRYDEANAVAGHRDSTSSRRILAYLYARQPDGTLIDVNAEMCRAGMTYDYARRYPHRRGEEFRALIEEARRAKRGYWGPPYQPL